MIYRGSNQRIPEYNTWCALCVGMGIQTYVELGIGSSWEQAGAGMKVVTVDLLPNGLPGIHHIQGDSHSLEVLYQVLKEFDNERPDCVFIDADHSYEAVKADFDMWYPAAGKLIGFHDILMDGVNQFWNEIKRQYPSVEIIGQDQASGEAWQRGSGTDGDLNVGGIGAIFKDMSL